MNCSCVCLPLPIYTQQLTTVLMFLRQCPESTWSSLEQKNHVKRAESWHVMCPHEQTLALLTPPRITHLGRLGCLGWEGTRLHRVRLSAGEYGGQTGQVGGVLNPNYCWSFSTLYPRFTSATKLFKNSVNRKWFIFLTGWTFFGLFFLLFFS